MGPLVWISLKRLVVQGPISYLVTGVSQFVQIGSYISRNQLHEYTVGKHIKGKNAGKTLINGQKMTVAMAMATAGPMILKIPIM